MSPRTILRHLITRCEAEVGSIARSDFAAWEGDEGGMQEHAASGRLHLAEALIEAREALASGNDERIADAALTCPTLERTGREMQRRAEAKSKAKTGGHRRGETQSAEAEARWAPYVAMFRRLLDEGRSERFARGIVALRMKNDGLEEVSTVTLRKRLSTK